jgi:hypothetical protein
VAGPAQAPPSAEELLVDEAIRSWQEMMTTRRRAKSYRAARKQVDKALTSVQKDFLNLRDALISMCAYGQAGDDVVARLRSISWSFPCLEALANLDIPAPERLATLARQVTSAYMQFMLELGTREALRPQGDAGPDGEPAR